MLKSLRVKDFGCLADTSVEFNKVTLIVGPNGAGKSTIRRALDYALTGRCEYTDLRGAGAEYLIRDGAKKATIELEGEGLSLVRQVPNALQVAGMSGTTTDQQKALYEALGVQGDVLSAAINTSNFINASQEEQKAILFRLAGMAFDEDRLLELLAEWQKSNGVSGDLGPVFDDVCPRGLAGGPEVFTALEKAAVEARRLANKAVKDGTKSLDDAKARPAASLPAGVTPDRLLEAQAQLADLKRERDGVIAEIGKAEAQATERFSAEEQVKRVKAQLAAIEAETVPEAPDVAKIKERIAAAERDIEVLRNQVATQEAEIVRSEGAIDVLRGSIQRLSTTSWSHKCALADEISCPLTEEDLQKVRADLEERKATAAKALDAMKSVAAQTRSMLEEKGESLTALREALEKAQDAEGAALLHASRIENAARSLKEAQDRLAKLPAPASVDGLKAQRETLDQRIANGEALIGAIREEGARVAEIARLEKVLADATARAQGLDALVKAFSPDGIPASLLKETIEPLQTLASERLKILTGGEMDITFDLGDDFNIFVADRKGCRLLRHLSDSEKLRAGVLLQDVLNGLTGLRVLVIDKADMLDPRNRQLLMEFVMHPQVQEDYDTILVLATMGETTPVDPGIEGLSVYIIQDGQIERAPAAKRAA